MSHDADSLATLESLLVEVLKIEKNGELETKDIDSKEAVSEYIHVG